MSSTVCAVVDRDTHQVRHAWMTRKKKKRHAFLESTEHRLKNSGAVVDLHENAFSMAAGGWWRCEVIEHRGVACSRSSVTAKNQRQTELLHWLAISHCCCRRLNDESRDSNFEFDCEHTDINALTIPIRGIECTIDRQNHVWLAR